MKGFIAGGIAVALIGTGYSYMNQDAIAQSETNTVQPEVEAVQRDYDCGEVTKVAKTVSTENDSVSVLAEQSNFDEKVEAFYHEYAAEKCSPWGQFVNIEHTSDGGSLLAFADEDTDYTTLFMVQDGKVVEYTRQQLFEMGLQELVEFRRQQAADRRAVDTRPNKHLDYTKYDADRAEIANRQRPDLPINQIEDEIKQNHVFKHGPVLFEIDYPH